MSGSLIRAVSAQRLLFVAGRACALSRDIVTPESALGLFVLCPSLVV